VAGLRVGYPGLTYTAEGIASLIGECDIFCEPFAGLGRISKNIVANKIIVNDMSDFSIKYLNKEFPDAIVTQDDFVECIKKHDSKETTFFFDPPWSRVDYAKNPKTFCDRGVGDYYKELAEIVPTIKGKWFCAGRVSGGSRSTVTVYFKEYNYEIVRSNRKINGHNAQTKVYFNKGDE